MIFSALRIFLVVPLSESMNGPISNVWNLLCFYFALDHTSTFEIIYTRIDDRQFVRYYSYVQNHQSQPVFTYSKLTKETLEQGVKYVQS